MQSWMMCQMESGDREAHGWICRTDTFLIPYSVSKIRHMPLVTATARITRLRERLELQKESKPKEKGKIEAS